MNEGLDFPDATAAVVELIDGNEFAGQPVTAGVFLPIDGYGALATTPFVRITYTGGSTGWVDEVSNLQTEVFATAPDAEAIAQAIRSTICGTDIQTSEGVLDSLQGPNPPTTTPFQDRTDRAVFVMTAVARPLN